MEDSQGTSSTDQNQIDGVDLEKKDTVAYETYKKLLGQRKSDALRRKEIESELDALKNDVRAREQASMEEQGKHKELAEHFKSENESLKALLTERDELINDGIKLQAFKQKVGGEFKNPKYMSFVDLEKIEISDDGSVNEATVEMTVNSFLKEHGNDLLKRRSDIKIPSDAAKFGRSPKKNINEMSADELSEVLREKVTTVLTK